MTALAVTLLFAAGCAGLQNPHDVALQQKVTQAIGEYSPSVLVSAAGDRIYLSGELHNFTELQTVLERVRAVPGVHSVMYDDVELLDPGSPHDSSSNSIH